MGLYEVPLSVSLLSVGIGTMLANFHVRGIMFLLKTLCKEKKKKLFLYRQYINKNIFHLKFFKNSH